MSGNSDNQPPEPDVRDSLYKAGKTGITIGSWLASLAGIPVGGLLSEFFSVVIKPPIEKRWNQWAKSVIERLEKSEYTLENLSSNQLFISTFVQASHSVFRTHLDAKRDALRIAVINTAKPIFIEDNIAMLFLNWVDLFTEWHLRVLQHLKAESLASEIPTGGTPEDERRNTDYLIARLKNAYPGDEIDFEFLNQVIKDLSDRGLLVIDTFTRTDEGNTVVKAFLTNFGEKFLEFITD